jgi:enamine deaminase RidA (YjgF/YER057c/UK114 family)
MPTIEKLRGKGVYDPPGYHHAIKVTGAQSVVFVAGQLAYDEGGTPACSGDFVGQARQVFRCIQAHLEAAGGSLANVVKLNAYVTDIRHRPLYRQVREEFFEAKGPASTMVQVVALAYPEHLIEIEAIAVL